MAESAGLVLKQIAGSSGMVMTKSILPHPILRELHSDIELMLTNCIKTADKNEGQLLDLGPTKRSDYSRELVATDDDSNLLAFCNTLEKAFRDLLSLKTFNLEAK